VAITSVAPNCTGMRREQQIVAAAKPPGHIGGGNLHYGFKAPEGMTRETFTQYKPAITRAINDLIRTFGGSISAEHGIGQEKLDELAHYSSPVELATMKAVKAALDPKNIMNPGKILRMS